MTDTDLTRPARTDNINSEHFRRTKAEKLRTVDAKELRDVTAGDLEKMYQTGEKRDKDKS